MKILIAADIFPPDIGGPATYSQELAKELAAKGHFVSVICYSNKIDGEENHFPMYRILRRYNTLLRYCLYFLKALKISRQVDVIYAQGPVSSGLPAAAAAKFLKKKFIVKVVGDYAWEQAVNGGFSEATIDDFQKQKSSGKIGWLIKIERWVCNRANKIIVPSQYLKGIVAGWGVDSQKIEVIYNSISTLEPVSPIENNEDVILSVGRLVPWKGFDMLIDIMPELLKINPNFKLVILGKGPDGDNLRLHVNRLNLQNKVEIKRVDFKTRNQYLFAAKIFVLNTGYEGLSHTILEAMQAGLAVITTDVGGNPELIQNNHNGLLIPCNNRQELKRTIIELYNNPEIRKKYIINAKESLLKFSFSNMIESTIKVLNS